MSIGERSSSASALRLRGLERLWSHLGLVAILVLSAGLHFTNLSQNGYGKEYYAMTVRSMLQSWHNFFFAAYDPGGFVSVDKPAFGFWVQAASAALFGFHGLSLLLPQALAGLLSVALIYHLVQRVFGRAAGLIAALTLALTPISVATSRSNNLDMLLVLTLLLVTAAVQAIILGYYPDWSALLLFGPGLALLAIFVLIAARRWSALQRSLWPRRAGRCGAGAANLARSLVDHAGAGAGRSDAAVLGAGAVRTRFSHRDAGNHAA